MPANTFRVKFAIFRGDEDQNIIFDLNEIISVYKRTTAFAAGQEGIDNNADLKDVLIFFINSNAFVNANIL